MPRLLHESLRRSAERFPNRAAFRCRGESINYETLSRNANQLANTLLDLGIHSMDRVGIAMSKCLEMPIAVYGTLAAGAAYVPIDMAAPPQRIAFIAADCGIEILIATPSKQRLIARLLTAAPHIKAVIGLPEDALPSTRCIPWSTVYQTRASPPSVNCLEDDLAYIMYTSGSTGVPKGLMHTHRSGLAYARHSAELYGVTPSDILGNHAPLHFDISTFEFITGPFASACSVLIPEEDLQFPASLAKLIETEKLTFWYSVPLALIQLLTRGDLPAHQTNSLRWVLFGGEPFPPKYLRELMLLLPDARFCNVYGPAEVNQCTYYEIPRDEVDTHASIPIGHVWKGARALIVNDAGVPVDDGEAGELIVQSATMMAGYWGRPDLSARAFAQRTAAPNFDQRYYRTGDIARRDANGLLHFLGRKDRQVKIRGYRLELDEVEFVFASQSEIEEAAAFVVSNGSDEKNLIVAVTIRANTQFDHAASMAAARSKLPHYGVPSSLEVRAAFPRTTSGKIDRHQLAQDYAYGIAS